MPPVLVTRRIPGSALDILRVHVDVDRVKASEVGLTQQVATNSILVSLSGTTQVTPNYWVNPVNRVNYVLAVQTPPYRIPSVDTLTNTPIITGSMQVIGQPPGTGAVYQGAAQPAGIATEHLDYLVEARRVLLRAPGPVPVQVDVVVSEPLLEWQARAEPLERRLGDARFTRPQRRQQFTQPPDLVLVGGRHVRQPTARGGAGRIRFGGAYCLCLRGQVPGQESEPAAPIRQRLPGLGKQPGDPADDRKAAAAAPADPAGAGERNGAAAATRAGEDAGKRVLIDGRHRDPVRVDPRGNAGGGAGRGQRGICAAFHEAGARDATFGLWLGENHDVRQ